LKTGIHEIYIPSTNQTAYWFTPLA